jgi:hypothetical protein
MPKPYGTTTLGKIDNWLRNQPPGRGFTSKFLWEYLFKYEISRSTINAALKQLAANNKIRKSPKCRGPKTRWIVL